MAEKKYIEREKAYETITDLAGSATTKAAYAAIWKSAKELNKIPAADVVEVVRCKDCKYKASTEDDLYCRNRKGLTVIHDDDYCCYGEREEN